MDLISPRPCARQISQYTPTFPSAHTTSQPGKALGIEGGDTQADTTLDRAAAIEDCSRLALEAEQSLPIARTVGEALAVLSATVSNTSNTSPQVVATVSSEVASAVVEAEELVDDLLRVLQVSSRHEFPQRVSATDIDHRHRPWFRKARRPFDPQQGAILHPFTRNVPGARSINGNCKLGCPSLDEDSEWTILVLTLFHPLSLWVYVRSAG